MSVSILLKPPRRSLLLAIRKPPVWSASWPRPLCGSARSSVLVVLEGLGHRPVGGVSASGLRASRGGSRPCDAFARLLERALGAQAGRVHRIDADVGAVGGVDDRGERDCTLGGIDRPSEKKTTLLRPGIGLHRADDRQQRVGGRVALLVALERLELLEPCGAHAPRTARRPRPRRCRGAPPGPAAAGTGVDRIRRLRSQHLRGRLRGLLARVLPKLRRGAAAGGLDAPCADAVAVARERLVEDRATGRCRRRRRRCSRPCPRRCSCIAALWASAAASAVSRSKTSAITSGAFVAASAAGRRGAAGQRRGRCRRRRRSAR